MSSYNQTDQKVAVQLAQGRKGSCCTPTLVNVHFQTVFCYLEVLDYAILSCSVSGLYFFPTTLYPRVEKKHLDDMDLNTGELAPRADSLSITPWSLGPLRAL